MKGKLLLNFIPLMLVGIVFVSSCESEEALPQYQNPNTTDTTGINIAVDLFVSAEIENIPYNYSNGLAGYSNWTLSEEEGFCIADTHHFVQSHITAFIQPTRIQEAIYIDIRGCVNNDSLSDINVIDSVLVVGPYKYYPKSQDNRTAIVKFIDQDSVLWSTAFGGNESSFSRFEVSAVVNNDKDEFSQKIVFGKFEGYFYNGMGDSLKIKDGQFKGRIVK